MKLARRQYILLRPTLTYPYPLSEIATITYRSGPEWDLRFGRKLRDDDASPPKSSRDRSRSPSLCPDFLIETYLDHQVRFCRGASTKYSLFGEIYKHF